MKNLDQSTKRWVKICKSLMIGRDVHISVNPKPTIYRNLSENTGPEMVKFFVSDCIAESFSLKKMLIIYKKINALCICTGYV